MNKKIVKYLLSAFVIIVTVACLDRGCAAAYAGETPEPAYLTKMSENLNSIDGDSATSKVSTAIPTQFWGELFYVKSLGAVDNGATPPDFSLGSDQPANCTVTNILTYHWNEGDGVLPGSVGLQGSDGSIYGPFPAMGEDGMGGVPNAYWSVLVNIPILHGVTYTVIDSDHSTWAQNEETDGVGITTVWGYCSDW